MRRRTERTGSPILVEAIRGGARRTNALVGRAYKTVWIGAGFTLARRGVTIEPRRTQAQTGVLMEKERRGTLSAGEGI